MIRKLKALGLIALSVLAVGVALASNAQSQGEGSLFTLGKKTVKPPHTESEIFSILLGGEAANYVEALGSKLTCKKIRYKGTEDDGTAVELNITPEFEECFSGELPATVFMNGCFYRLLQTTTIESGAASTGNLKLECPGETPIQIKIYSGAGHGLQVCEIRVEPFESLPHVVYKLTKVSTTDVLTAEVTVDKVPYVVSGLCAGEVTKEDGVIRSKAILYNELKGKKHDFWISH